MEIEMEIIFQALSIVKASYIQGAYAFLFQAMYSTLQHDEVKNCWRIMPPAKNYVRMDSVNEKVSEWENGWLIVILRIKNHILRFSSFNTFNVMSFFSVADPYNYLFFIG